jgi:hypothetical protein
MNRALKDATLQQTDLTMPTADGTVHSQDFETGDESYKADVLKLRVKIPDLTTTHLPDADTLTVNILAGSSASPTDVLQGSVIVLTGAGGAGASGVEKNFSLPSDCPQYVRAQIVAAGGTGDMSALDAEVGLVF